MKKWISIITVLVAITCLTSCEPKVSETITFKSQDENIKIEVYGERYTSVDPWRMTINQILADTVAGSATTEAFFDEPNEENVVIEWITPQKGIVKLIQKDGTINPTVVELQ